MQIEIDLLTTEAEYISLSQSIWDLIPWMQTILDVPSVLGMKFDSCNSYTITFKDNKGSSELSKEPKYRPWSNQLSFKWHHFRDHIRWGTSKTDYIETNEQKSDIMEKPLSKPQFEYLRK